MTKSPREIGRILKETRQEKNLSLEKIWNATRIQGKVIEALEEGRADDILARVYVLLFLRKYASFLELDTANLIGNYKAFYLPSEKNETIPDAQKKPSAVKIEMQKWTPRVAAVLAVFISVFFVMSLGMKLVSFYRARRKVSPVVSKPAGQVPLTEKATGVFPILKSKKIELALKANDDVWMKVWKDGRVSFEGTLGKNKKKAFSCKNKIKLWIGRAEALDFTINGTAIGRVGRGNIKNIEISRSGLKVGKKWLIESKK